MVRAEKFYSQIIYVFTVGTFLTPNAYTLTGVMAVNGSDGNGGCPSSCVGVSSGIITCDCTQSPAVATTTGVLIDGVVPTLDTAERNAANDYVWAAPLLTVRGTTDSVQLGFRFQDSVLLHEVQLHLFNCPAWNIGAQSISIIME